MKNKSILIRPLLTLIFLLSVLFPASAYDFEYNGLYYNILSQEEKTVEVTYEKYDEKSYRYIPAEINGALKIPEEVQCNNVKYKVTKIGEKAFIGSSGLTSVVIPNMVTEIGESAFQYCSGLTSVVIPNSVKSIGSGAFFNCSGLTSVVLPNSVKSIGSSAFSYCSGLTYITIPGGVTSVDSDVFGSCSNLRAISVDAQNGGSGVVPWQG